MLYPTPPTATYASPTPDPALVPASTYRVSSDGSSLGLGSLARSAINMIAPSPTLFSSDEQPSSQSTRDKNKRLTVAEHLASAVLLNEEQLKLAKKPAKDSLMVQVRAKFFTVLAAAVSHAVSLSPSHWASFLLLASVVKPWAIPQWLGRCGLRSSIMSRRRW